jgi:hypothetical protein
MDRTKPRSRPVVEALEGRALLSASKAHVTQNPAVAAEQATINRFAYTDPSGDKVVITLTGVGSLAGTSVTNGVLSLVYSGTNLSSGITGKVTGGTADAPLLSIKDANVALASLTGVGGSLIGRVQLPRFELISGGDINLSAGVNVLTLDAVAPETQIHLRDTPLNTTNVASVLANTGTGNSSTNTSTSTNTGTVTASTLSLRGAGTLEPVATGFGGANVGAVNGAIAMIPTVGNGQNYPGTPGLTQAAVNAGRSLSYSVESNGGVALTGVAGTFLPGPNLIEPRDASRPGPPPPPPGVIVTINHVNGGPSADSPPLGDAQVWGYDATAGELIRFDAVTGVQLQTISLPSGGATVGGVALVGVNGTTDVLAALGTTIDAFNASTGAFVGQFSAGNLLGLGISSVAGLGSGGQTTVLEGNNGLFLPINVTQSLASGFVVSAGTPFTPSREFVPSGGLTGVAGTGSLYSLGGAHFDTFQPNVNQAGVLAITPSKGTLSEASRTALTSQGTDVPANANGTIAGSTTSALGSYESYLALDTGVVNGQNVLQLLSPNGLTKEGTLALNDANVLVDLSESFHPELTNTALVDVQGNVQSFTAKTVTGLVLNDAGNLNLLSVGTISNSSVAGFPFSHVQIANRGPNVLITSSSRLDIGGRGGVVVTGSATPIGPLFLP